MHIPTPENANPSTSASPVRPGGFQKRYLATQPMPYSFVESSGRTSSSGGVLRSGQCVWLDHVIEREHLPTSTCGFAESVGLIVVDPRQLKKADGCL
jgi:hypothetical protein